MYAWDVLESGGRAEEPAEEPPVAAAEADGNTIVPPEAAAEKADSDNQKGTKTTEDAGLGVCYA